MSSLLMIVISGYKFSSSSNITKLLVYMYIVYMSVQWTQLVHL